MIEYELWDIEHGEQLLSGFDTEKLVELLQIMFETDSVLMKLDSLELVVYTPESEVEYFTGVENIEEWLSRHE